MKQGHIYKIVASGTESMLIGSTWRKYPSKTLCEHRYRYFRGVANKKVKQFFDKHGVENTAIFGLEQVSCKSKGELFAREMEWTQKVGEPFRTPRFFLPRIRGINMMVRKLRQAYAKI